MPVAIDIQNVSHRYPGAAAAALADMSMQVQGGEIFGVLGPNGSGKTTLFRILATMLRPDAGRLTILGRDVLTQRQAVRQRLGVAFQSPSLDGNLTVRENLVHGGRLYGLHGRVLSERIEQGLTRFGLGDRRDERVERLSGGLRRRVELAKALLHEPPVLLLDEPSVGLDPGARLDLWRQLESLRRERGVTIALTTHLMDEADRCDRLVVMARGQIVALDSPANLKAAIRGDVLVVAPRGSADPQPLCRRIAEQFGPWANGAAPRVIDGRIHLEQPDGPAFVATLAGALAGQIESITVGKPTLDDVFMHLTGHGLGDEVGDVAAS